MNLLFDDIIRKLSSEEESLAVTIMTRLSNVRETTEFEVIFQTCINQISMTSISFSFIVHLRSLSYSLPEEGDS